jgi:hypothetical protein
MVERLSPIWEKRRTLLKNPEQTKEIVEEGRNRASRVANQTMQEVKAAMKIP